MRRLLTLAVWLLLLVPAPLRAGAAPIDPAPGVPAIERAIEHLELESATLQALALTDMRARLYYQARILFVQYLVSEPPGLTERFQSLAKSTLQALEKLPASDPHKDWMMAEVFFMRGVLKALQQQAVSAAVDMKSACDLAYRSSQKHPALREHQKLTGIFHVAMATLPRKLQWLGNVLCFKGDLDTGLRQLEGVAREGRMLPNEAQVLLFYFEKNLLSRPEAAHQRAKALRDRHPRSRLFNYLLLSSHLELRQIDQAIQLAHDEEPLFAAGGKAADLPIWHYTVGKAHFFRLEYPQAIAQFDRFLAQHRGRTLRADALYRKGVALFLSGRSDEARGVFVKFAGLPRSEFDADEYATKQAAAYLIKEPGREDRQLYAARNLFDGGYYQRSMDTLNLLLQAESTLTENQRTELHYRLGRNQHALERLPVARRHYEACIGTNPGAALWMKVYAMYYLGRIEEEEGNKEKARTLYRTALSHNGYPYQSGLEQRTKTALAELKKAD